MTLTVGALTARRWPDSIERATGRVGSDPAAFHKWKPTPRRRPLFGGHTRGERPSASGRRRYVRPSRFQAGLGQEESFVAAAIWTPVRPLHSRQRSFDHR